MFPRGGANWLAAVSATAMAVTLVPISARAQDSAPVQQRLEDLEAELKAQRGLIEAQARQLTAQQLQIEALTERLVESNDLATARGTGGMEQAASPGSSAPLARSSSVALAGQPVGEAPEVETIETQVEAVPQGAGVLTPAGRLVFDPSIEYTSASNDRLVFRGIELVPGIQIGVIEASKADRDTAVATAAVRYGLTDRLEVEVRVPFLSRADRIEVVQQRDGQIVRDVELSERGLGDIELAARYQFNRPVGQRPIFVGSLRVKSDTGKSPFEIPFDDFGIATGLATGSGFWAAQPGINVLVPSDPVVLYGGASYLYHMPRTIDRLIGDVRVGRVDPGDAINGNVGFGFALNPRFSYSLGYRHSYIFPTETELGDTTQRSSRLQVGSFTLGMSYRVNEKLTANLGFDFGVTEDAPDLGITLRMPFGFNM